jgi:DnaJ-class molecular chaperone
MKIKRKCEKCGGSGSYILKKGYNPNDLAGIEVKCQACKGRDI